MGLLKHMDALKARAKSRIERRAKSRYGPDAPVTSTGDSFAILAAGAFDNHRASVTYSAAPHQDSSSRPLLKPLQRQLRLALEFGFGCAAGEVVEDFEGGLVGDLFEGLQDA